MHVLTPLLALAKCSPTNYITGLKTLENTIYKLKTKIILMLLNSSKSEKGYYCQENRNISKIWYWEKEIERCSKNILGSRLNPLLVLKTCFCKISLPIYK